MTKPQPKEAGNAVGRQPSIIEGAGNHECIGFLNSCTLIPRLGEATRRGFGGYLTPQRQSALVAALACASLLAVTPCVAAESAATQGGSKSPSAATAKVAAKAAKSAAKKAASAKSKEKKSESGKPTVAAVPLPRARLSGASARARAASGPQGASTDLAKPPAVPPAQAPTPQTSDPDVALVKSAIDSLRSGDADKATRIEATISDPVARKLVEWVILRSDRNGAGSARYTAFIAANPSWPSLATVRRRAEALL